MSTHVTFRQLQVFVGIARGGSVSAAARQLSLSQSAASQALGDLERQLGVVLFERLGRRLELNDAGSRLLAHAEKLLQGMDELVDAAQEPEGALRGTLHVTASATLAPICCRCWPGASVNVIRGSICSCGCATRRRSWATFSASMPIWG